MRAHGLALVAVLLLGGCATTGGGDGQQVNYSLDDQLRQADQAYREARLDDAERIYRQILQDHGDLKDAWFRLGNIYTREDQLEAAVRAYERTLQLDKNDGRAWYNLSLVHMKQALRTLEVASQALPADSPYRERIAALHDSLLDRLGVQKQEEPQP
jgi:tetratricopeptide (TPR) repeat protein